MRRALLIACLALAASRAAALPEEIRPRGTLRLAVNATYAPMEYRDPETNTLKGLDIDLAAEMAKRLGVGIAWSEVPFAELILSLQSGRSDFVISGISDRASRRDKADFIDYLTTGAQFFVLAGSPAQVPADLCGKRIGTTRSTSFPAQIEEWSAKTCATAGRPPAIVAPGENSIDVRNQLKQGRIDAAVQGSETLPYAQGLEAGRYRVVGAPFTNGYQGIMVRKEDAALRETLTATLRAMIADGTYGTILARYGLSANAVPEPLLNASDQ
ncbi:ABC transporter substrate-binding protein [Methylobacterium frigidaeris]|uniref:Lysine/arginine/ornithine-binding periplasmic protein n=2 Tax=Methylobacterium frigidaeris TaxID=2038277 RepID=A0AA37HH53_9HYPH|nr:ABC transporter substrate-binding protein [Methylobacterium frigidaeris]PIK74227.1 ABC transporter substrate-binding protein [Methylobacterium frigidaeris]GJD65714.1 Lysine/arginine/ornithine-binding periplasmic protein [Methylobacterium frigidaeris]